LAIFQYKNLTSNLARASDGSISEQELTELVHLSRSLIQAYLGSIRSSLTHLCQLQGLTINDLAYDCIAEAFAKDDKNRFHQITNFVESLSEKLDTVPEQQVFLAYKSFMLRVTDAQLARLYALSDPAGAKIHRNVRDCVKQSSLFMLEKDYRGLVMKPKHSSAIEDRSAFPIEELEQEFLSRVDHTCTTQQMLQLCYEIVTGQSKYRQSVPLAGVVQMFKKVYGDNPESVGEEHPFVTAGLAVFEIDHIRVQVETALKEKIVLTYLARGKLNRKEAEAVFNAFQDMLEDWCAGEQSQSSLYHYLKEYLQINEETYEATLRTKMEYLLKVAREEFAARLMRDV